MQSVEETRSPPWWCFGMMWLVVAGPALVVVAGVSTFVIAERGRDIPLSESAASAPRSAAPAVQARNHAATAPR